MAARPTHDLAIKTGEFTDQNGQTKGRWLNIGTVFRHDDGGTSIKLDALPVGLKDWGGWVSVFKREPKDSQGQRQSQGPQRPQAAPAAPDSFDEDIPF